MEVDRPKKNDEIKKQFAELAVFVWVVYGIYTQIFHRGRIGIIGFLIYYSVGIFIAAIASVVTYLFEYIFQIIAASLAGMLKGIVQSLISIFMMIIFPVISIVIQAYWIYWVSNRFISLLGGR